MSLRLAWAGPWNERSAIALFGTLVVAELHQLGHRVEVIRTEVGEGAALPPRPAPGPIHTVAALPPPVLAGDFDGVVVNLGNHYGFHGGALPLMRAVPCLAVLHDVWMRDFLNGWRHAAGADAPVVDAMVGVHGAADSAGLAPLCAMAAGAVVHGAHGLDTVRAACPGPVARIPLAYAVPEVPPPRLDADRLVVATVGHINDNKRADQVIRAIGASARLRRQATFLLIGPVEPAERARLLDVARRSGTPEPHFTGWVPDEVLYALMARVDVFCCLRHPVSESGSASLVSAMLAGRPTLVSDHASYAELPDGLVLKCPPGAEAAHVLHHLETILDAPEAACAMGERARNYARRVHAPSAYAAALLPALAGAARAAPGIRAARAIGTCLAEFGMLPDDPAAKRAAEAVSGLLGRGGEQQT